MECSSAAELILNFDSNPDVLFDGSHPAQAERYLRAVEELRRGGSSTSTNGRALRLAMAKLEGEFRNILLTRVPDFDADLLLSDIGSLDSSRRLGSEDFDGEESEEEEKIGKEQGGMSSFRLGTQSHRSRNSLVEIDLVPSDVLYDLRIVAEKMISAGYRKECFQAYGSVRKGAIESCLQQIRLEKLSVGEIQRLPWEAVEAKIPRWIRASEACFRLVFASERRLCDLVFDGLDDVGVSNEEASSDVAFAESVIPVASRLLDFAEAIGLNGGTPERLFKIVDLHVGLRDLMPEIESVFFGPSSSIRRQAEEILSKLVEAVEEIFSGLESAIRSHSSKAPVPGGAIHPMTRYVMNYLGVISDYRVSLSEIIFSKPSIATAGSKSSSPEMEFPADNEEDRSRPLSSLVLHLIATLASTLEGMAKLYNEDALSQLFVMNNLHYIVHKVKETPELREMIGDDYRKRLTGKYRMAATMYQREAWGKIINMIHRSGELSRSALRERLRSFNAAFEESYRSQSGWAVPDDGLKEEMRIMISERLLPAYSSFLSSHKMNILKEKHPESYVKYTVEDLEKAIGDFFEGAPPPPRSWRRSVTSRFSRHSR